MTYNNSGTIAVIRNEILKRNASSLVPKKPTKIIDIKDLVEGQVIHHSLSIYGNGERVTQGVLSNDLQEHIEFNKLFRFGRALFIDGILHNQGYLTNSEARVIAQQLKDNPVILTQVVLPYR